MITDSDAVVEPRAVVVEALDAPVTNGTVTRARSAQDKAIWAHLAWMDFLEEVEEVVSLAQVARVLSGGDEEANSNDGAQSCYDVGQNVV